MFKFEAFDEPRQERSGPGRRRRDRIDCAQTRTWARAVVHASGLSLRALDEKFGVASSGTWSRYAAGLVSPTNERVGLVEEAYPGTSRYFLTKFWDGIRPDMLGRINPQLLFDWLEEPMRAKYVLSQEDSDALFWRKESNRQEELIELIDMASEQSSSFDVAQAIVAITHEAVFSQSRSQFIFCVETWARYCAILEMLPPHALVEYYFPGGDLVNFGLYLFEFVKYHPYFENEESIAEEMFGT